MPWDQSQLPFTKDAEKVSKFIRFIGELFDPSQKSYTENAVTSNIRKLIVNFVDWVQPVFCKSSSLPAPADQIIGAEKCSKFTSEFEFIDEDQPAIEASNEEKTDKPKPESEQSKHADHSYEASNDTISLSCKWAVAKKVLRSDYHNFTLKEINPTKFIKDMENDPNSNISAVMTAFIGTDFSSNKLAFTMKKMYIGVQSTKGAYLYQLQVNMVQKTTTLVKYFERPPGNSILKIVGTKDKEAAEDVNQLLYLELDKSSNKIVLGVFLTNSKKYKNVLSFPFFDSMSMSRYFRVNKKSNILSFQLNSETYVVLFTVTTKPGVEWFSNVGSQCVQIVMNSSEQSKNKSNQNLGQVEPSQAIKIEGFVTEMISQEQDVSKAISVVATSNRQIHLYELEYPTSSKRASSKPLAQYTIRFDKLRQTLSSDEEFDMNLDSFKLNNMFLVPELNNKLIVVYVAINEERKQPNTQRKIPRVDILISYTEINTKNKQFEQNFKDEANKLVKNSDETNSTKAEDNQDQKLQKNPQLAEKTEEAVIGKDCRFVVEEPKIHRLTFDNRDLLGKDWAKMKIMVSEVKVSEDNRLFMMLTSDSQKIQELIVIDDKGLTHFSIKDVADEKIASADNFQVWHNKSSSTLHVLSQSLADNQRAIRDLTFDVNLAQQATT